MPSDDEMDGNPPRPPEPGPGRVLAVADLIAAVERVRGGARVGVAGGGGRVGVAGGGARVGVAGGGGRVRVVRGERAQSLMILAGAAQIQRIAVIDEQRDRDIRPQIPVPLHIFPQMPGIPPQLVPSGALDISPKKDRKLWMKTLYRGWKKHKVSVKRGMTAMILYKSWFANDPSKEVIQCTDKRITVTVGDREICRAIDEALTHMTRKRQKVLLLAHYEYAYGRHSSYREDTKDIPNMSFICFEMEFLYCISSSPEEKEEDEDKDVKVNITREYELTFEVPRNSVVFVQLTGFYKYQEEGEEGEEEKVKVIKFFPETILPLQITNLKWGMNEKSLAGIDFPKALAPAVRSFVLRDGQEGWITLKGGASFSRQRYFIIGQDNQKCTVPAGATVKFFVRLKNIEEVHDPHVLPLQEKVSLCQDMLFHGINYGKKGYLEAAAMKFLRVKEYLESSRSRQFLDTIPVALNRSADILIYMASECYAKLYGILPPALMDSTDALKNWDDVIYSQPQPICIEFMALAYFQRGLFWFQFRNYLQASNDFHSVLDCITKYVTKTKDDRMNPMRAAVDLVRGTLEDVMFLHFLRFWNTGVTGPDIEEQSKSDPNNTAKLLHLESWPILVNLWETEYSRLFNNAAALMRESSMKCRFQRKPPRYPLKYYPAK